MEIRFGQMMQRWPCFPYIAETQFGRDRFAASVVGMAGDGWCRSPNEDQPEPGRPGFALGTASSPTSASRGRQLSWLHTWAQTSNLPWVRRLDMKLAPVALLSFMKPSVYMAQMAYLPGCEMKPTTHLPRRHCFSFLQTIEASFMAACASVV
jgi:hypothetical protein